MKDNFLISIRHQTDVIDSERCGIDVMGSCQEVYPDRLSFITGSIKVEPSNFLDCMIKVSVNQGVRKYSRVL